MASTYEPRRTTHIDRSEPHLCTNCITKPRFVSAYTTHIKNEEAGLFNTIQALRTDITDMTDPLGHEVGFDQPSGFLNGNGMDRLRQVNQLYGEAHGLKWIAAYYISEIESLSDLCNTVRPRPRIPEGAAITSSNGVASLVPSTSSDTLVAMQLQKHMDSLRADINRMFAIRDLLVNVKTELDEYQRHREELERLQEAENMRQMDELKDARRLAQFITGLGRLSAFDINDVDDECAICKEKFFSEVCMESPTCSAESCGSWCRSLREPVVRLPCKGGHLFDLSCITKWLEDGPSRACPMDRENMF